MWSAVDRVAGAASRFAFYIAVLLLLVLMIIGTLDVLMTQFNHPIPGAVELSEAGMAVLIFLGLGQVQRDRGHIIIDLFTQQMSAAWARRSLIVSSIIELLFMVAMAAAAWALSVRSLRINESAAGYLDFPLYPGKALVFAGIVLATVELLRQTIQLIARRDFTATPGDAA